jgi:MFS family permease
MRPQNIPIVPFHYAWIVLATGTLVVFASLGLARFGYTMVLPSMQSALGLTNTQTGVLATANLVGYLALSLIGGALAARYGARIVITSGLAVASIGMLMTGLAENFASAAFWRGLTGIGSGASNVPVMGLLAAWFAQQRRGFATGIGVTGSSLALILLGIIVPPLLIVFGVDGWRVCWFSFAGLTGLLALLSFTVIRNYPSDVGLAAAGASIQNTVEESLKGGLKWKDVYRSKAVWYLGVIYVAFGFSYIIYMTFFMKFLTAEGGFSQPEAGRLFMLMGWFSLLCGLVWGSFSDRLGRKNTLVVIYLIQAFAFCLFALKPPQAGFVLSAALFGFTAWSIPAIMAATCGDLLGPRLAPAGIGFVTLFFGIGQAAGPAVAGLIADTTGSLSPALLLASAVALSGALGSFFLKTVNYKDRKE